MKFSIRDLLLVTVIVALAGAWWLDHRTVGRKYDDLRAQESILQSQLAARDALLTKVGCIVEWEKDGVAIRRMALQLDPPPTPPAPVPKLPKE